MQGLVRATALAFAPLSLEQAAVVKAYFREIVAVGFEAGLLWKGMIQYPSGEISAGLEDVVNYCWDKVRALCSAILPIAFYTPTDAAILRSQITGMAVARGVGHKYSLLIDVETGRPFELEVIVGSVLRLAQKHNIETPRLEYTYVLLKVLQGEILREKRLRVKERAVVA